MNGTPRSMLNEGYFLDVLDGIMTGDFFHCRLDQMVILRHPPIVSLLHLKQALNDSYEGAIQCWLEPPAGHCYSASNASTPLVMHSAQLERFQKLLREESE